LAQGKEVPPKYEIVEDRYWQFSYKKPDGTVETIFGIRDEIWLFDFASEDHFSVGHECNKGIYMFITQELPTHLTLDDRR
jgi:hypothetical protein